MKTKKLKAWVIPTIYLSAIILVMGCLYALVIGVKNYFKDSNDFKYAINAIDNPLPIINVNSDIDSSAVKLNNVNKPYLGDNIEIGRNYYDVDSDSLSQEKSIIFFENTYIQNTGVDYVSENAFDIVSILPGKVLEVSSDENLGNIIKIEHSDDIISVYECVDDIKVKVGDEVTSGQVIAKSGTSNINKDFKYSLHFEIFDDDININPNNFLETINN